MQFDEICYKTNYVNAVILKVDFKDFEKSIKQDNITNIIKVLPLYEKRLEKQVQINLENGDSVNKAAEAANHVFSSENRTMTLTISELQKAIWLETKKYSTWKEYFETFLRINEVLSVYLKDYSINRIGLRFINQIPFSSYAEVKKNLSKNISTLFIENSKEKEISRLFVIKDLTFEDSLFRFQFGIPNQYFPNPILVPEFVLDFDAYSVKTRKYEELNTLIENFHYQIQCEFEKAITDAFRKLMGTK